MAFRARIITPSFSGMRYGQAVLRSVKTGAPTESKRAHWVDETMARLTAASELQMARPAPRTTAPSDNDLATIPAYVGPFCFAPRATIGSAPSGMHRINTNYVGRWLTAAIILRASSALSKPSTYTTSANQ